MLLVSTPTNRTVSDDGGGRTGLSQGPPSGVARDCAEAVKAGHPPKAMERDRGDRQGERNGRPRRTVPKEEAV
jgi:hypothetical protein